MMYYIGYVLASILLADLLTGIFHWWEDRYGNPDWYILGDIVVKPNINHHKNPRDFTEGNYIKRNWTTILPCVIFGLVFYYYENYFMVLTLVFASQSNEIHCWEHMKTSFGIRFLQRNKILQDVKTHALHHKRPYDTNYCVMTMLVNPVLNKIRFWTILEKSIGFLTGIYPRQERYIY